MKNLDPEDLFKVFEMSDEELVSQHDSQAAWDFRHHPFILIGMVIKGLENFEVVSKLYTRREGEAYVQIEDTVQHTYYTSLYKYLYRFNYQSLEYIESALKHDYSDIESALTHLRTFFESREEFEKSARIRDILEAIDLGAELLLKK